MRSGGMSGHGAHHQKQGECGESTFHNCAVA
jgi:hypothetical protein